MKRAIQRNVALFGGMIVAGVICAQASPYLRSVRGALGPTIAHADAPVLAATMTLLFFAVATLAACYVGRILNAAVGLFVLGAGVFVLSGRMESVGELAMSSSGTGKGTLIAVAIETFVWAVLVLGGTMAVFGFAGRLRDIEPDEHQEMPHPFWSGAAMKCAAMGVLVLPVVWIIAQSPLKGQMIGATFVGAMLAGLGGRLLSPHVQPMILFASPVFFGAVGHLIGAMLLKQPLDIAFARGQLSHFSLPMPLDYAAGSLMGVSMGLGWAKSFLQHDEESVASDVLVKA